jgi:hypothetical protein
MSRHALETLATLTRFNFNSLALAQEMMDDDDDGLVYRKVALGNVRGRPLHDRMQLPCNVKGFDAAVPTEKGGTGCREGRRAGIIAVGVLVGVSSEIGWHPQVIFRL